MADRILDIERKIKDVTLKFIDDKNFLGFGAPTDRIDTFIFAMSLGIKEGKRTPLNTTFGLVREGSVKTQNMSKIFSLLVDELIRTNETEKIADMDEAFKVAQEYANTGFNTINKMFDDVNGSKDDDVMWALIADLDCAYENIFEQEYK